MVAVGSPFGTVIVVMEDSLALIWDWIGGNASNLIALAALAVAVGSLWLQRRHNRLSVHPLLVTHADASGETRTLTFGVANCGIGPALIRSFTITCAGVPHVHKGDLADYNPFVQQLQGINCNRTIGRLGLNTALEQGENFTILKLVIAVGATYPDGTMVTPQNLQSRRFADTNLIIEYESMYGDPKVLDTSLDTPDGAVDTGEPPLLDRALALIRLRRIRSPLR